jgi:transposase
MKVYVGLDVSQLKTALCVVNEQGKIIYEDMVKAHPLAIAGTLKHRFKEIVRVGLETGAVSPWLVHGLRREGLEVVCMDGMQTHRTFSLRRNKTDTNDARGIAELVRLGPEWIHAVHVKSLANHQIRTLLTARSHFVKKRVEIENTLCGMLRPFGGIVKRDSVKPVALRERILDVIKEVSDRGHDIEAAMLPFLALHRQVVEQIDNYEKQVEMLAKGNPICERLMTVPGVGPVVALSFYSTIEDPKRFARSCDVAAYLGLTPRVHQSGDMEYTGRITKRGDDFTRRALVQAATVMLTGSKSWSRLKASGVKLAQRSGFNKARIAVASLPRCFTACGWTGKTSSSATLRHKEYRLRER